MVTGRSDIRAIPFALLGGRACPGRMPRSLMRGHCSSCGVHSWLKVGSAARQRLMAKASVFDLNGAPTGN